MDRPGQAQVQEAHAHTGVKQAGQTVAAVVAACPKRHAPEGVGGRVETAALCLWLSRAEVVRRTGLFG